MQKPIRVLQVVPNMQAGGIETLIMNLYRNVDRSKIQFDFLVHYKGKFFYDDEIHKLGGKIYHLSVRDDNNIFKYLSDLNNFFKNHTEYKAVHGHMVSTAFFYLYFAKKYGVKLRIVHSHNTSTNDGMKGWTKAKLARLAPIFANQYFACGRDAGKYLYGSKRFQVFNNGIDLNKFKYNSEIREKYRKELGLQNKFVVGHIGRFNKQKNHRFLIQIFNELQKIQPNAILLLVGDGELKNSIEEYVNKLGLKDKVKFLGLRKDTFNLYQAMDVFLLPSLFEGFPVVAVEAQDAGLPIFTSTNVTKDVEITPLVSFESLNESPKKWAVDIKNKVYPKRKDYSSELSLVDYDIKKEAEKLTKFYSQVYK